MTKTLAQQPTHLRLPGWDVTACNRSPETYIIKSTTVLADVTCGHCRKSRFFRQEGTHEGQA